VKRIGYKGTLRYFAWLLFSLMGLCPHIIRAQTAAQPSQELVDKRVSEIIDHALQEGVITTPEGVRATPMKAHISIEQSKEIRAFGDLAIHPLTKYLDSPSFRAQHLAVNLLGYIGGKRVIKSLSHAADRSSSPNIRAAAVKNLGEQAWSDVADVIHRVAINDPDPQVKKAASVMIEKHQQTTDDK
jgi:HEAT repeat protein